MKQKSLYILLGRLLYSAENELYSIAIDYMYPYECSSPLINYLELFIIQACKTD